MRSQVGWKWCGRSPTDTRCSSVGDWDAKFKDASEGQEFLKILKDLGQPANYLPSADHLVWAKANYETYGRLLKEFGLETK